jgi:hypothetical protein
MLCLSILAFAVFPAHAQVTETTKQTEGKPVKPPAVFKFDVTFKGENAGKIKEFLLYLTRPGAVPADQSVGFINQFNSGWIAVNSTVSHAEVKVLDDAMTGDYWVSVGAHTTDGANVDYDKDKIGLTPIHIDNPTRFPPPKITVVEQP